MRVNKARWATAFLQILFGIVASATALIVVIPILVAALPFWLVAKMTRTLVTCFQPSVVRWPDLFEFHPLLGWKAKPDFNAYCLEERDDVFEITTGSDGWPGSKTIEESDVVVFGDSHAFGYGVDTKRAFFSIADVRIKTIGAPGYNMVQEVLLIEELASSLKGKLVVWFVYYGNDLYDNLAPEMGGYRTPFVAQTPDGDWTIVTCHISPSKWVASSGRQGKQRHRIPGRLYRRSFLANRAYSACEFLIRKGRNLCHDAGADFVVMTVPTPAMLDPSPSVHGDPVDVAYPDQMIQRICKKLEVQLVCLKDILTRRDYKANDEHWTERGHRRVARVTAKLYMEKVELRNQRKEEPAVHENMTTRCSQRFSLPL